MSFTSYYTVKSLYRYSSLKRLFFAKVLNNCDAAAQWVEGLLKVPVWFNSTNVGSNHKRNNFIYLSFFLITLRHTLVGIKANTSKLSLPPRNKCSISEFPRLRRPRFKPLTLLSRSLILGVPDGWKMCHRAPGRAERARYFVKMSQPGNSCYTARTWKDVNG